MFKEHVETLHGIARLIIVRVAPFRRPLGIFSSTAIVSAIEIIVETEAFLVTMRVAKIVVEIEAFFGRRCSESMLRRCTV